jgi:hypothetical protein
MSGPRRIGLIVPSSNVTMETELPELLARHPSASARRARRASGPNSSESRKRGSFSLPARGLGALTHFGQAGLCQRSPGGQPKTRVMIR